MTIPASVLTRRRDRIIWLLTCLIAAAVLSVMQSPRSSHAVDPIQQLPQQVLELLEAGQREADRGDLAAAEAHYRAALMIQPMHEQAYKALLDITDGQTLPRESEVYRRARASLPGRFRTLETRRFVIFSDADPHWTSQQGERLERAHHQFHRFARRLDLRPLPLRHKLVCILFDDREAYRDFASEQDHLHAGWTAGHYSTANDWIVFYNAENNPSVTVARSQLAEMRERMEQMRRDATAARSSGDGDRAEHYDHLYAQYREHLKSESNRVDSFTAETSTVTTLHEAVHMLLFHTNVQSRSVTYPIWISEGLATSFESDRPNEAFGPDRAFENRAKQFVALMDSDALLPLRALASIAEMPHDEEAARVVYPQSYALVHWMHRFRRDDLRRYLNLMRLRHIHGELDAMKQIDLFERCFGSVDQIEAEWLRWERGH